MRVFKKSLGRVISFLLLLTFSAAVFPLDFYHNHATEETVCNDRGEKGSCEHKLHLSKKSKSCWACAVHYDQMYIGSAIAEFKISLAATAMLSKSEVVGYYVKLISTSLRGPPAE